jgi:hypothetical protein
VRIDDLDRAQGVTAVVDTIIFENGCVIGPDESRSGRFHQCGFRGCQDSGPQPPQRYL